MPFLLLLPFDPVEHERAQAQVADEHDETDEPSSDHFLASGSSATGWRSIPVTIAAASPPDGTGPTADFTRAFSYTKTPALRDSENAGSDSGSFDRSIFQQQIYIYITVLFNNNMTILTANDRGTLLMLCYIDVSNT